MKRFLKKKSSAKQLTDNEIQTSTSASTKTKKKKSFFKGFFTKKKDKSPDSVVIKGAESQVHEPIHSAHLSSCVTEKELIQDSSGLSNKAKSTGCVSPNVSSSGFSDAPMANGYHEVQPSLRESVTLSDGRDRNPIDVRLSLHVITHSSPCLNFHEEENNAGSDVHQCLNASRSCDIELVPDSCSFLLQRPRSFTRIPHSVEDEAQSNGNLSQFERKQEVDTVGKRGIDFRPGTLWIGQEHPVTFSDGTSKSITWSLNDDRIIGKSVDCDRNQAVSSVDHPEIPDSNSSHLSFYTGASSSHSTFIQGTQDCLGQETQDENSQNTCLCSRENDAKKKKVPTATLR